jgi:replicative DNA helicase
MTIGGWIPTKVTTIAARSGHGKTALTSSMFEAGNRVSNGRKVAFCFFTWEMESSYLVDRYVTYKTGISGRWLTQGARLLTTTQREVIKAAFEEAKMLGVVYQEMSINISQISTIFRKFCDDCRKQGKDTGYEIHPVGIIDYIGMAKFNDAGLRTYGIGDFMSGLKALANETGGSFCALAQISRAADEKSTPTRSDLSDSKSIEDGSDNLIILNRPEYNLVENIYDPDLGEDVPAKNRMSMNVVKGRDFGIGQKLIGCSMHNYRFWNLQLGQDYPYWELYEKEDFWRDAFGLNEQIEPNEPF